MTQNTLTADVIAKEALAILSNNLVAANLVHRGFEEEFDSNVNGYKKGSSVRVRRPAQFGVRTTEIAQIQEVKEGNTTVTVDTVYGVDFQFSSTDMTLSIGDLGERVMKPALVRLANQIDARIYEKSYKYIWNWVGTPGQTVNSFTDFAKAPERLDNGAVPTDARNACLTPADYWGMLGTQTGLFMQNPASDAYRRAKLGMIGNVDTYMAQSVTTHTTGDTSSNGAPVTNGTAATNSTTYEASKITNTMSLVTDGWTAAKAVEEGDVFTIATVYAVNPVTKATLPYLQQFVVRADATADGSGNMTLTISPPIITSDDPAYQTVSNAPADAQVLTFLGTAATGYPQNLVFHKNAIALTMVPMEMPAGSVGGARKTFEGISVRVVPTWDGVNNISFWRCDVLFGVDVIDPRLATRLSGTA
jgi:hypothetical protein